jgi:hypothetical protein
MTKEELKEMHDLLKHKKNTWVERNSLLLIILTIIIVLWVVG